MNKKLKELLDQINSKKAEVVDLTEQNKLDDAENAKKELIDLQKQFDLLKDVLPEEKPVASVVPENRAEEPKKAEEPAASKNVHVVQAKDNGAVHRFADAARHLFRNADPAASSEGVDANGGYIVPQDIQTYINQFKEAEYDLSKLVSSESVNTDAGRRTFQTRAQLTGFTQVGEMGKIGQIAGPQFQILEYAIKKYAGFLPVTNELLADTDQNITNVITKWIAKQDVATRNALILAVLNGSDFTKTAITGIKDLKKIINVTLGAKFSGNVAIYTNDDGLNFLDSDAAFADKNGRSLITPDLQTPMQMVFAAGAQKVKINAIPNEILPSDTTTTKGSTIIPVIVGDLKEAVALFDRKKVSISNSNTAVAGNFNAFDQDMTIFRAIDRLDVKARDTQAAIYGQITVKDSTATS